MNKTLLLGPEYLNFLAEMKRRIADARLSAARAVNRELILLYWDLGRAIVEKQTNHGWGESVVEKLAKDLREAFPHTTGFSAFNLWRMRQFYILYASPDFLAHLVPEIKKAARLSAPPPMRCGEARDGMMD